MTPAMLLDDLEAAARRLGLFRPPTDADQAAALLRTAQRLRERAADCRVITSYAAHHNLAAGNDALTALLLREAEHLKILAALLERLSEQ